MFLVDANVIIDASRENSEWRRWSVDVLQRCLQLGALSLNPIIYAEVSGAFDDPKDVDHLLRDLEIGRLDLPYEAAFLASKAFLKYRQAGGVRTTALPDFLIGAHAKVETLTLITRDAARFRTYFPAVALVTPERS